MRRYRSPASIDIPVSVGDGIGDGSGGSSNSWEESIVEEDVNKSAASRFRRDHALPTNEGCRTTSSGCGQSCGH